MWAGGEEGMDRVIEGGGKGAGVEELKGGSRLDVKRKLLQDFPSHMMTRDVDNKK